MRKKTVNHLCDQIFWYIIYMLPALAFLVQYFFGGTSSFTPMSFEQVMLEFGVGNGNIIYDTLFSIFGAGGILPFFFTANSSLLAFVAWFGSVLIVHLAIDFVLFIPRLAHKWLNHFYQGD